MEDKIQQKALVQQKSSGIAESSETMSIKHEKNLAFVSCG